MIGTREQLMQLLRFLIVGLAGTALYALLAFGLIWIAAPLFLSHAIASVISLIASYFGHKSFTFQIAGDHARRGPRFILATVMLVTAQSGLVLLLDRFGLDPNLTIAASTLFYPPSSYLLHTLWTFRRSEPVQINNASDPDT